MTKHFWQEIDGYFTFPDFYAYVAAVAAKKRHWWGVEVGAYTGQSAAFMFVELENLSAEARFDLVDCEMSKHRTAENLSRLGPLRGELHEMLSLDAAKLYGDASLDFVFIDANHEYDAVAADIDAWRPKVRSGGLLAGHDYKAWPAQRFGVCEAVNERFARFEVWPGSKGMGDEPMKPHHWPVWAVRL